MGCYFSLISESNVGPRPRLSHYFILKQGRQFFGRNGQDPGRLALGGLAARVDGSSHEVQRVARLCVSPLTTPHSS